MTKENWIDFGLQTLTGEGAGGLAVERMAVALKVSRGSFYWHFRDIADFRAQLLQHWQERSTDSVIRSLEARQGEQDRLRKLVRDAFASDRSLDRAIRNWAASDAKAAAVVASVDRRRIASLADLLADAGVARRRAAHRAAFLYWAYLGQVVTMDAERAVIPGAALDDICALFES